MQSLVEKIPEGILRQTIVQKKKVSFRDEANYFGLGKESGEWPTSEEDAEEEKLSGSPMNGMKTQRRVAMTR